MDCAASTVLLQHEKSNDIALNCATTKRHTVVCTLDMEQAIAYLRVSTQRQHRSGLGPIDIHCIQIIAAARWMKPVKLAARLS